MRCSNLCLLGGKRARFKGRKEDGRRFSYRGVYRNFYVLCSDREGSGAQLMAQATGLVLAILMTGYLVFALLFPERFK